jgi:hypothetical protein
LERNKVEPGQDHGQHPRESAEEQDLKDAPDARSSSSDDTARHADDTPADGSPAGAADVAAATNEKAESRDSESGDAVVLPSARPAPSSTAGAGVKLPDTQNHTGPGVAAGRAGQTFESRDVRAATLGSSNTTPTTEYFTSALFDVPATFDGDRLFSEIDDVKQRIEHSLESSQIVAGTAVVLATGVSLAQVAWLLRGSIVATQMLSSVPIWGAFDPLPVLTSIDGHRRNLDQSDESLVNIVSPRAAGE